MRPVRRQRGAVIIIVLWTSVLLTILVTVMAAKVQLSARTALHNQTASFDLAAIMTAMNHAEMELMLERMAIPVGFQPETDSEGQFRIPAYRFNGQPLTLAYPVDEEMVVRIYDHAGKINLNRMPREQMRLLIENRLGEGHDPDQVEQLLGAWTDWTDLNDIANINGAENAYYQNLDPPYSARNNPELETVAELRLIRGFDELFRGVDLEAAFTVHGNGRTVNLNLATREAMQLLPGMDEELIEQIIALRQEKDFRNKAEVGELVPLEQMTELSNWIGNNTSSFYSIYVYPKSAEFDTVYAYRQIIEVRSFSSRGQVYEVDPYARLPAF
ncbi:MAG: type II secretion system protein GspK [Pseudomonadales bacterium]|nr:type II secretion system protein GspK [Pseudomonadales bacterium]